MIFLNLLSIAFLLIVYLTSLVALPIAPPTPPMTEPKTAPSAANFNLLVNNLAASPLPSSSAVSLLVGPP